LFGSYFQVWKDLFLAKFISAIALLPELIYAHALIKIGVNHNHQRAIVFIASCFTLGQVSGDSLWSA